MATIKRFEDLKCWQKAFEADKQIFEYAKSTELRNDYPLKNQVLKSSGSVMDNIAEGFNREGKREFINFLSIAKASGGEAQSQLYRMLDRLYITKVEFETTYQLYDEICGMIQNLIGYLNNSELRGYKFKNTVSEPEPDYAAPIELSSEIF